MMGRVNAWLERVWEKHQGSRADTSVESREDRQRGLEEARRELNAARGCTGMVQRLSDQINARVADDLAPKIAEAFHVAPRRKRRRRGGGRS